MLLTVVVNVVAPSSSFGGGKEFPPPRLVEL